MGYNKHFGKIESNNVIKFAPDDRSDEWLTSDGWLPIIYDEPYHQDDQEYVYIAIGWEEVNGHIQKKYQRRKRLEYMREYSRDEIINRLGERYQPFVQNLQQNYPELLSAFDQSTIYLESCNELHKCMKIYGEMYNLTDE
jgi:hypothetical protein